MSPQQQADILLQQWQANREIAPEERMGFLVQDFFSYPSLSEYERVMCCVHEEFPCVISTSQLQSQSSGAL